MRSKTTCRCITKITDHVKRSGGVEPPQALLGLLAQLTLVSNDCPLHQILAIMTPAKNKPKDTYGDSTLPYVRTLFRHPPSASASSPLEYSSLLRESDLDPPSAAGFSGFSSPELESSSLISESEGGGPTRRSNSGCAAFRW